MQNKQEKLEFVGVADTNDVTISFIVVVTYDMLIQIFNIEGMLLGESILRSYYISCLLKTFCKGSLNIGVWSPLFREFIFQL